MISRIVPVGLLCLALTSPTQAQLVSGQALNDLCQQQRESCLGYVAGVLDAAASAGMLPCDGANIRVGELTDRLTAGLLAQPVLQSSTGDRAVLTVYEATYC